MKLKVARFAPPGVNRATTGFSKIWAPMGLTLEFIMSALNLWINATLTWKPFALEDKFEKFPLQKP